VSRFVPDPDPVKPATVSVCPAFSVRRPVVKLGLNKGFEKVNPARGLTLNWLVVVPVAVCVLVEPFVSVIEPLMPPVIRIDIDDRLPRAGLNCAQETFALSSVGLETMEQLVVIVGQVL